MKNKRPVYCKICGKQMYYESQKEYEKEKILLIGNDIYSMLNKGKCEAMYVHLNCWNNITKNWKNNVRK